MKSREARENGSADGLTPTEIREAITLRALPEFCGECNVPRVWKYSCLDDAISQETLRIELGRRFADLFRRSSDEVREGYLALGFPEGDLEEDIGRILGILPNSAGRGKVTLDCLCAFEKKTKQKSK